MRNQTVRRCGASNEPIWPSYKLIESVITMSKKSAPSSESSEWASAIRAAKEDGHVIVLPRDGTYYYKNTGHDLAGKDCITVRVGGVDHVFVNTHPDPGSKINLELNRYAKRFKMITPDGESFSYFEVDSEVFERMIGGGNKSTIQRFKIVVAQELAGEKLDAKVNVDCKNGQLLKATPAATLTDSKTTDASPSGSVSKTLEAAPSGTVSGPKPSDTTPWATLTVSKASAVPVAKPSGQTPEKKPAKPAGEPATGAGQKPQAKLSSLGSTLASRENANQLQPGGKPMGKPSDAPITGNRLAIEAVKPSGETPEKKPAKPAGEPVTGAGQKPQAKLASSGSTLASRENANQLHTHPAHNRTPQPTSATQPTGQSPQKMPVIPLTDTVREKQKAALLLNIAQRRTVLRIIDKQHRNLQKGRPYVRIKAYNPISCNLPAQLAQQLCSELDRQMYKCSVICTQNWLQALQKLADQLEENLSVYKVFFTDEEIESLRRSDECVRLCDKVEHDEWSSHATVEFRNDRQDYPEQYEAPVVKGGQVTLMPARKPWTEEPHDKKRKRTEYRHEEGGSEKRGRYHEAESRK